MNPNSKAYYLMNIDLNHASKNSFRGSSYDNSNEYIPSMKSKLKSNLVCSSLSPKDFDPRTSMFNTIADKSNTYFKILIIWYSNDASVRTKGISETKNT